MKNTGFFKSGFTLLVVLFMALAAKVEAQNIQLHYDVRRNCATSTVEMFRADNYGSTFFFIDMDFAPKAVVRMARFRANSAFGRIVNSIGSLLTLSTMVV